MFKKKTIKDAANFCRSLIVFSILLYKKMFESVKDRSLF
ncbi:hypothetical protein CUZ98_2577 [Enterococcus faecium]|nr:hypothetical protein [Enterococcus faecium]MBK4846651.1 hypothetical protein [Enterococcus faecium]MBK4850675.1 hypothetical protein [Enterococcus faecium]